MNLTDLIDDALGPNPNKPAPRPNPDAPGYMEWDGATGYLNTGVLTTSQPADFDDLIRKFGLDPDEVVIVGNPQLRMWDAAGQDEPFRYYRITVAAKSPDAPQLPDLDRIVKRAKRPKLAASPSDRGLVVAFADLQAGKVDHRGGTDALIERAGATIDLLEDEARRLKPDVALFADVGDIVEEFHSAGGFPSQATSNDLSLMDQITLAATIEAAAITAVAKHSREVVVAGVGSNHCRWRQGSSNLGKPNDDWGLFILGQIKQRFAGRKKFEHVRFVMPELYTEHVVVDVKGTHVGVVHGHQAKRQDNLGKWWAEQSHGGSSLAGADLLLAGHFHNYATYPSGRSSHTGREKRVYVSPTLDNGSSWFRNGPGGADSDPGLLILEVQAGTGVVGTKVLRPGGWQ